MLEAVEFEQLAEYLNTKDILHTCKGDLSATVAWLTYYYPERDTKSVTEWLGSHGGYCDCEIMLNVWTKYAEGRLYQQ